MEDKEILRIAAERLASGQRVSKTWLRETFGLGDYRARRLMRELAKHSQPQAFLHETGIDPNAWDVERILVNKWGAPGEEQKQIKVWLYRKEDSALDEIKQSLANNPPILRVEQGRPDNLLALLSIFDLHVGMLAWHAESGENYDTRIALEHLHNAASYLIGRIPKEVKQIVIPIGNDILHADTHDNTTTAGTRVDVDSRWQRAFVETASTLIRGPISWAAEVAPVHIVVIPGNHDYQRAFYLGEVLRWYYEGRGLPVSVDNAPRLRKYITFGRNLLGFTHGAWVKPDALPMIMAQEASEAWGSTKWREWIIGHFHRKKEMRYTPTMESGGVRIRVMPTLASPDAWHYQQGFVGGVREATLTLYDANIGPVADFYWR